jgi:NADH dehydrogenase (ubiquinone) Fe-S protein 8
VTAAPTPRPDGGRTGPTQLHAVRDEGHAEQVTKQAAAHPAVPDYSRGPSALDKAAQLFFFTEILRGEWRIEVMCSGSAGQAVASHVAGPR